MAIQTAHAQVLARKNAGGGGSIAADGASSTGATAGATTVSWSHTCSGSDRLLFVAVFMDTATTVTSVTYNGVAMAEQWDLNTTGVVSCAGYTLVAPATGSNTVEITFAGLTGARGWAQSFTGVHQSTPVRTPFTAIGSAGDSQATVTVTDAVSGDVVVDSTGIYINSITMGAGQTLIGEADNFVGGGRSGGSSYEAASGSTVMNWTHTNTYWVIGAVALKPA